MAVTDGYLPTPRDGVNRKVDASEITRADGTKTNRQRVNISDAEDTAAHAAVKRDAGEDDYGLTVRLSAGQADMNDVAQLLFLILHELTALRTETE